LREALDRRLLCPEGSSRPAPEAVLSIAHDIASALLHLHCEGIVHGDIKAANILLSCPGESARSGRAMRQDPRVSMLDLHIIAKVADFGLALILGPSDTHATQHSRVSEAGCSSTPGRCRRVCLRRCALGGCQGVSQ
jgi:serine/threonine protein kinase